MRYRTAHRGREGLGGGASAHCQVTALTEPNGAPNSKTNRLWAIILPLFIIVCCLLTFSSPSHAGRIPSLSTFLSAATEFTPYVSCFPGGCFVLTFDLRESVDLLPRLLIVLVVVASHLPSTISFSLGTVTAESPPSWVSRSCQAAKLIGVPSSSGSLRLPLSLSPSAFGAVAQSRTALRPPRDFLVVVASLARQIGVPSSSGSLPLSLFLSCRSWRCRPVARRASTFSQLLFSVLSSCRAPCFNLLSSINLPHISKHGGVTPTVSEPVSKCLSSTFGTDTPIVIDLNMKHCGFSSIDISERFLMPSRTSAATVIHTADAELSGFTHAAKAALWLQDLLTVLRRHKSSITTIFGDAQITSITARNVFDRIHINVSLTVSDTGDIQTGTVDTYLQRQSIFRDLIENPLQCCHSISLPSALS